MRKIIRTSMATVVLAVWLCAQPPLAFEAVSIRPHPEPVYMSHSGISGTRATWTAETLLDFIVEAYGLKYYQVSGGPRWLNSDHFDISARAPGDTPLTNDQLKQMLQALLADRFRLGVHRETKEMAVYSMTVAKGGPKFRALKPEEVACWPMCSGMNEGHGESFAAEGSAFTGAVSYAFGVGSAGDR